MVNENEMEIFFAAIWIVIVVVVSVVDTAVIVIERLLTRRDL